MTHERANPSGDPGRRAPAWSSEADKPVRRDADAPRPRASGWSPTAWRAAREDER